jgi:hypothetical protein
MTPVFLGSEALAKGKVTEYALRRWHRRIFRDVYVSNEHQVSLRDRIAGAWLRSGRQGIVAGVAASALHGASWVDDDIPIELIWSNTRPPRGIIARDERAAADEVMRINAVPVTNRARTALDLGRHLRRDEAVARLDALMWSSPFSAEDVLLLAKRYHGARGIRRIREVLPLVDGGADSPRETWLRLLFVDAELPRPTTQIPVHDGLKLVRTLDMGWEDFKVAAEYDGDQHRTNRRQYVKDMRALPHLEQLGWIVIRVIKEDSEGDIIERASKALRSRGWQG